MRSSALALLFMTAAFAQEQVSDEALGKAKQLTVMINATVEGDARPGAGIIFGLANDQVYIATADHLVRRGASQASDIRVEFKWLPGQPQPAELLTWDYPSLDLAVIVVDRAKARAPANMPFDRLGDPAKMASGAGVWAIGYPDGTAFDLGPGQLNQREALRLTYRAMGAVPGGYSGGPLVDRNGLIVGMVRQDLPPNTEATRVDLIVEQLKAKDFPVALREPGSSVPPGTSQAPPDAFRKALLRMVAESPSGFRGLGAPAGDGSWNPTVWLPEAIDCRGQTGGTIPPYGPNPIIVCKLFSSKEEAAAVRKLQELTQEIKTVLPAADWKIEMDRSWDVVWTKGPNTRVLADVVIGQDSAFLVRIIVWGVRQ